MARKTVERNISYDEGRKLYYVNMDLGRDANGKRVKQYRTFPNITQARADLQGFQHQKGNFQRIHQHDLTLGQWLNYTHLVDSIHTETLCRVSEALK